MRTRRAAWEQSDFSGGMNDSPGGALRSNQVHKLKNFRVLDDGTVQLRPGSRRNNAVALTGKCWGYFIFNPPSGATRQRIAFFGTEAYRSEDYGSSWTSIASALTEGFWTATTFRSGATVYMVFANGSNQMYTWNGSTWGSIVGPTTGIQIVATHGERLYCAKIAGTTLYGSKINDMTVWTTPDGLSLPISPDDGDTGIHGLWGDLGKLLILKRESYALLDGTGTADLIVQGGVEGFRGVGVVGPRAICSVPGGVAWLSKRGVELWSGGSPQLLSQPIDATLMTMDWTRMLNQSSGRIPHMIYNPSSKEIWVACQSPAVSVGLGGSDALDCDYVFRWRSDTGAWAYDTYQPAIAQGPCPRAMVRDYLASSGVTEETIVCGTFDGWSVDLHRESAALDIMDSNGSSGQSFSGECVSAKIPFKAWGLKKLRRVMISISDVTDSQAESFAFKAYADGFTDAGFSMAASLPYTAPTDARKASVQARAGVRGEWFRIHAVPVSNTSGGMPDCTIHAWRAEADLLNSGKISAS